jgi:hypothetical protein
MSDGEDRIIRAMRHMAWERAKGELRSMLHTHYHSFGEFQILQREINDFIQKVEDEGIHE